uniref:Uncharacterized protein n=1 Tax=Callorhinchus milii TaxID=7868 RepID=A0A4W3GY56_CALMI
APNYTQSCNPQCECLFHHCVYSDPCYVLLSVIVRLSDIDLTTDSTEDLSSDLKINHKLTELNLSHNNLGDRGVKRLCEALRNPECKIQSLR